MKEKVRDAKATSRGPRKGRERALIVIRILLHFMFKPRQGYLQPFTCSHCSNKLVYLILDTSKHFEIFDIMLDFCDFDRVRV